MKLPALLTTVVLAFFLAGCSSVSYNNTVFDYYLGENVNPKSIKRIVLATVNVSGEPTRSILRDSEDKVDSMVIDYLKAHGYELAPQHLFNNAWQQAKLNYGEFYDPTTGRVDRRGWQQVMSATLQAVQAHKEVDAILFTDLLEHDVQHSSGMKHYARWWGVSREPATQGGSTAVPVDFNWTQVIKGASLMLTLYDREGKAIFNSRGGIDTLYGIDSRKSQKGFVRRSRILSKSSHIQEGIELAFHPFIVMARYPAPPKAAAAVQ